MAQDRIAASPQSPVLGALARHLRAARSLGDEARIPLIDMGLGELLLGKAPEEIEEWSYGNLPFQRGREGIGSRIPQLKRGRAEGFMDATMGALDAAGVGALARRGLTAAAGSAGTRFGANPIPQIGAIKPRGGNWIPGDVESSIENLFRKEYTPASVDLQRTALEMAQQRGYDDNMIAELARGLQLRETPIALNRWIEGPLTKYIKRDMATPEDPIRRLAEQGVSHIAIPENRLLPPTYVAEARAAAGFPEEGMSADFRGSFWENLSDGSVHMGPARYLQEEPKLMKENPWMRNLDPESDVYGIRGSLESKLGFDHLIDELNNAMNPDSGLPRNLLLRPEQMQQMGVEKAVRHVDAINKWREAQRVAADAELANRAMVLREYPDTPEMPNPKGLRWMELGGTPLPQDRVAVVETDAGWRVKDKFQTPRFKEDPLGYPTREEALAAHAARRDFSDLEKQLKYEGDVMGHCVGGYCTDVIEGRSRIFSLRDARGEPHVTIEVAPPKPRGEASTDYFLNHVLPKTPGNPQAGDELFARVAAENDFNDVPKALERTIRESPEYQEWARGQDPFTLVQVKGKQNLKPKDEYLPFVQDFLRNSPVGEWGSVSDLKNTGLRDMRALYGEEYPSDLPRFMTEKEQQQFNVNYPRVNSRLGKELDAGIDWEPDDGYAAGGLVDGGIDDPVQFALQWRELVDAENGYRRA